ESHLLVNDIVFRQQDSYVFWVSSMVIEQLGSLGRLRWLEYFGRSGLYLEQHIEEPRLFHWLGQTRLDPDCLKLLRFNSITNRSQKHQFDIVQSRLISDFPRQGHSIHFRHLQINQDNLTRVVRRGSREQDLQCLLAA